MERVSEVKRENDGRLIKKHPLLANCLLVCNYEYVLIALIDEVHGFLQVKLFECSVQTP